MSEQYDVNNKLHNDNMDDIVKFLMMKLMTELPAPCYENFVRKQIWITMSDGVKLLCDVHMPDGKGPWPVVIQRSPYGPVELPEKDLFGEIMAKQGYVYVANRCRGTGLSEGHITAFEQEIADGKEVIDFIAKQDFCDGNIGTYGASYHGHVQWCLAGDTHPAVKAMYIQVFGGHPYNSYYRNGMILQDIWQSWVIGNGGNARNRSEEDASTMHEKAFHILPPDKMGEELLNDPVEWAVKIFDSPEECDDAWQKGFWKEFEEGAKKLDRPIVLQCGWFDLFCQSQLDAWRALPKETREKSLCIIGPWDHYGFTNHVLPYEGQDKYGVMQIKTTIEWFDHHLKGKPAVLPVGGIDAYCIGDDTWRFYKDDYLTECEKAVFYLGEKALQEKPGENRKIEYIYDPKQPVRSLTLGLNKGTVIGPEAFKREDQGVYSFVSESFTQDVKMIGKVIAELYVSSTAPATAFSLQFFDVYEDGKAYLMFNDITDIRYEKDHFETYVPGDIKKITLECQDIAWTLKEGHKLRVDITSSDFPWYNAHNNTEVVWGKATESVTAQNTIYFGQNTPSRIILPLQ